MCTNNLHTENHCLKQRVAELEEILERIPAFLYINQIDDINDMNTGKNIWANKYALDTVCRTQEQIDAEGYSYFANVMHPDDIYVAEDSIQALKGLSPGQQYRGTYRIRTGDGEYQWNYVNTIILKYKPDGTPWQFLSFGMEVTDTLHTSKQLADALKDIAQLRNHLELSTLSKREKEVLYLIARGKTDKEIAAELCISPHTAHTHRNKLVTKTGTCNTAALVAFAINCGLA